MVVCTMILSVLWREKLGKLKDLLDEYKDCPENTVRDRELKEQIEKIVEWMKEQNIMTSEFKLPRKNFKSKKPFGLYLDKENGFTTVGNFIFRTATMEEDIKSLQKSLLGKR